MDADSSRTRFDRVAVPWPHEPIRLFPIAQTVYKYLYLDRETGTLYNGSLSCVYFASSEPLRMSDYPSRAGRSPRAKIYIFLNHIKASCDNPSAFLYYRKTARPDHPSDQKHFLVFFCFYTLWITFLESALRRRKKKGDFLLPTSPQRRTRPRNYG